MHGIDLQPDGKVRIETILSDEFQERPPYYNIDPRSMGYLFLNSLLMSIYKTYEMVYDRDGIADADGNKPTKNPVLGVRFRDGSGKLVVVQVDLMNGNLWRSS